jgi:uncharacterized membrane protein YdjX (TVP38/TMEM64 family)
VSLKNFETKSVFFKDYIESFGYRGAFIFIVLQLARVLVATIPDPFSALLGGYVFGFWQDLFRPIFWH